MTRDRPTAQDPGCLDQLISMLRLHDGTACLARALARELLPLSAASAMVSRAMHLRFLECPWPWTRECRVFLWAVSTSGLSVSRVNGVIKANVCHGVAQRRLTSGRACQAKCSAPRHAPRPHHPAAPQEHSRFWGCITVEVERGSTANAQSAKLPDLIASIADDKDVSHEIIRGADCRGPP